MSNSSLVAQGHLKWHVRRHRTIRSAPSMIELPLRKPLSGQHCYSAPPPSGSLTSSPTARISASAFPRCTTPGRSL